MTRFLSSVYHGDMADTYAPIAGFDYEKLQGTKPHSSDLKYSDAVRAFSRGLGSGIQVGRNNLGGMVDYARKNGFANAQAVGDDKIDFGDGRGAIDVVTSGGDIWFNNMYDQGGGQQGQGGSPSTASLWSSPADTTVAPAGTLYQYLLNRLRPVQSSQQPDPLEAQLLQQLLAGASGQATR